MINGSQLVVENAGVRFGNRSLWHGVSFSIDPGIRLGLVGPTGSGKTVLLRCLVGLTALDEGQVALDGQSLEEWDVPAYRSVVSYLAQTPSLVDGTVDANLRLGFDFHVHGDRAYDPAAAIDLLGRVGRDASFLRASAVELSGGERQIVALVRTLLLEPRVLLLDEPTASLDPSSTGQVEQLVHEWHARSSQNAVLWTSHDHGQIDRVADRRIGLGAASPGTAA